MIKHLEREDNIGEIKKGKKVDIDEFEQEAVMAGIRSVPTLVYYKDGKEAKRVSGVHSKEEILEIVNENK